MPKTIEEIEFTIFDTETTGLAPQSGDRIVEIAALRFKGTERIAAFQSLVNPRRPISEAAYQVNKISQEMVDGAPDMQKVMPGFLEFIKGSCLCSYNAGFDLEFLDNELKILNQPPLEGVVVVDILKMARRLLPGIERYALWFVADQLGIRTQQEHRAFSDVELTFGVFHKLKNVLHAKGAVDFVSFSHLFSINPRLLEDITNQKLVQIQEAIDLGVRLKIKYLSSSGAEVTDREVTPREIRRENNRHYMVGFCNLRQDERMFRLDGILSLEVI